MIKMDLLNGKLKSRKLENEIKIRKELMPGGSCISVAWRSVVTRFLVHVKYCHVEWSNVLSKAG